MKLRYEIALLVLLLGLAAPSRLLGLESLPPGLFHDEAYEGIDAVRITRGARPVFLPENYGREPLYAYLMALLVALDGPTVAAVRATSAIFGLLLIPAAYFWGRVFFGARIGLLTAVLTAASYWVLHESRLGMRPIALPPFLALASALTWLAARYERRWAWPTAGLALGLSLYTYLPARLFPLVVVGQVAIGLLARARLGPGPSWRDLLGGGLMLGLTALVALPLAEHFRANPEDATSRTSVVSILDRDDQQPVAALASNLALNLGMFVVRGDDTIRHNLPYRPAFDWLLAPAFLLGLVVSLRRWREPAHAALWLWLGVMFLPGLLSDSAPHFLRSIGLLPALFALPALGLSRLVDWLWVFGRDRLPPRQASLAPIAVLVGVLAGSQLLTWWDYFWVLPREPGLAEYFDAPRAALARVAGDPPPGTPLELPTPGWSYATIRFLRPRSFEPPRPAHPTSIRFATNAVLLGYDLEPASPLPGRPARLTLYWQALRELNASYVETVRLVDAYGRVWWQHQGLPGSGTLPTDTWIPGETVADHLQVELNRGTPTGALQLEVALAQPDGGRRLSVFNQDGRQVGNSIKLDGPRVARP